MIPDLFIVGATKCATYTLHEYLNSHCDVEMSREKEPHILCSDTHMERMGGMYLRQYTQEAAMYGECNANHFVIKYAPQRIAMLNPRAKVIILTRDPADRAFSHWQYMRNLRPGMEHDVRAALVANAKDFNLDKFQLESDYNHTLVKNWGNSRRMYLETGFYDHYSRGFINELDTLVMEPEALTEQDGFDRICDFIGVDRMKKTTRDRNVAGTNVEDYDLEVAIALNNFYRDKDINHILELK